MAVLLAAKGPNAGQRFALDGAGALIGRQPDVAVYLDSLSVSRHHALVLVGPRESIIEDLNSTNGVIVNGRRVTRQLLCDGDTITIGEVLFRYVARPLARAAEPQP